MDIKVLDSQVFKFVLFLRFLCSNDSINFAAIWAMFLAIIFLYVGGQVVFKGQNSPLQVGFLIGVAAMLCQLFFLLMCVFFVFGAEARKKGYGMKNK